MDKLELQKNLKRSRGIYLLPNLFTVSALFSGFYAIIAGMQGHFSNAAIAIFVAMLLDGLDGRVARLTQTQTAFGAELDSLSDMVSFGVAPALVAYSWALFGLGKLGWLAAFVYAVATALRLARFNTQIGSADKRYFQGLPSPAAAGVIAGLVWLGTVFSARSAVIDIMTAVIVLGVGLLMVSRVRYRSFKDINLKNHVPFFGILFVVLLIVLVAIEPPEILFIVFFGYAVSGPLATFWGRRKKLQLKREKRFLRRRNRKS